MLIEAYREMASELDHEILISLCLSRGRGLGFPGPEQGRFGGTNPRKSRACEIVSKLLTIRSLRSILARFSEKFAFWRGLSLAKLLKPLKREGTQFDFVAG
jgi:hypothetical protein